MLAQHANIFERLEQSLEPAVRGYEKFCRLLSAAGMAVFMLMVTLTFADVFLRYFFHNSLNGTVEATELFMVVVVFSSIAYTQWTRNHVVMDVLTASMTPRWQSIWEAVTAFWSVVVAVLCVYASIRYGQRTSSITAVLQISLKPFIYFVAFGFFTLLLTLLWDVIRAMAKTTRNSPKDAVLACFLAVVPVLVAWEFSSHRMAGMSTVTLGILGIVVMFALFLTGMPVAFALMATGFIFSGMLRGLPAAVNMYGKAMYATSASYAWAPLMFFMLMGYFCFYGDFGKDLYTCARRWLGHLRGGLAQGSVCACAAFGAVVGDVLSGSIAMSAIALPEMRQSGYRDELSVGCLACAGTIGSLIPPSTTLILYGVLAEQSIGELFIAGVVPGLLSMLCFILIIWIWTRVNPAVGPASPRVPRAEALASLKSALPIMVIFITVIGGIYGGVFTATEGGGVGVFGMLALAVVLGRMNFGKLSRALTESAKFTSMCFALLAGANLLGYFMTLSRIPMVLANEIAAMTLPPLLVMIVIILALCFLGCFIPAIPLVLICVPIFVPIAKVFGWNLIWFGIITTLIKNMACITPPFGINLFVMKGIADVPISLMYRASLPFIAGLFLCVGLIIAFPQLALWLPSMMH